MKKVIEFQEPKLTTAELVARWPGPRIRFEDQILKPEFSDAKAKLPEGTCTIRVLPPIKHSAHWWMPIDALTYSGGQHAHPRTLDPEANARSVFDEATNWFKQQAPKALYTKSTGKGFKLWTSPMAACWLLVTNGGRTDLKLLLASAFPGMTARKSGLAHQLKEFVIQNKHLLNPDAKCAIEMTRSLPQGSKYLETEFKLLDSDHTLNECMADLPSEQIRMVCPIEQTIRKMDQDDEWQLLVKAIGNQWTDKIRNSSQPIT
jgi:hypothetical protein